MKSNFPLHSDDLKQFNFLHRPSEGFVFVVTYGRSGSTLLQNLLNAIPGYCIRGENGNAIYQLCRVVHDLKHQEYITMHREQAMGKGSFVGNLGQSTDPWYGAENIDIDRFAKSLFNVFCNEILAMPSQTRVGGFKEIRYIHDLTFLPTQLELMQTYFPRAKIVFLTRDHTQVANSSWWKNEDPVALVDQLNWADQVFKDYAESHADCFRLDYSAYAGGPGALVSLFDFLEETMDWHVVADILDHKLTH